MLQDKFVKDLMNYYKYGLEYALNEIRKNAKCPQNNDTYLDSYTGKTYRYYNDEWVEINDK